MLNTRNESATPATLVGVAIVAMAVVLAVLLFIPAGRLDWVPGWAYLALVTTYMVISWACLLRWNPKLIDRRMRTGRGTKTWDKVWLALYAPVMIAVYIVAGFDARDGVSSLPSGSWLAGLTTFVLGACVLTWSMVVNPFFEKTVRIQTEFGHFVIDTGPYAYVRHPGYLGFIGWIIATPLLLASAWALVPALVALVGILIRTALEDRTLDMELAGYAAYKTRVCFRLIPGVW